MKDKSPQMAEAVEIPACIANEKFSIQASTISGLVYSEVSSMPISLPMSPRTSSMRKHIDKQTLATAEDPQDILVLCLVISAQTGTVYQTVYPVFLTI